MRSASAAPRAAPGRAGAGRSAGVPRGGRGRVLRADPAVVAGRPGAVRALGGQDRVDEADEVRVLLRDRQPVGLFGQLGAHDPGEGVVGPELTEEPYGLAIAKQHADFVRFVNAVLAAERADGAWAASYHRWVGPQHASPPAARYAG